MLLVENKLFVFNNSITDGYEHIFLVKSFYLSLIYDYILRLLFEMDLYKSF